MATKTVTPVILTSAQIDILTNIKVYSPYGVYFSQDDKKTALRLVSKGLALKYGKNTFKISAAGSKVLKTGKYIRVR